MRWTISISIGVLLLLAVLLILSPVKALPIPEGEMGPQATVSSPLFPVVEWMIAPGVGASPGRPMVDPYTGEVLICRDGGTTVISGTNIVSVIPDYCVMDVDSQTGRRFAAKGSEVAVLVSNQAVLKIPLPYTVAALRYNPKNGLLYVVTSKLGYPPPHELAVIQGNTVVYTMSLGVYGGHPEVHPDSGLMYVPDGGLVRVFSGTQLLVSLPVSSPVLGVVYHPFNRLVCAWGGYYNGEIAIISGTSVQSRISIAAPVMVAPDPNRDYAYVLDAYGQMVVISQTGVITVLQVSSPSINNSADVIPGSGEIVVGVALSKEVRIFPPSLSNPTVISTQIPPFAVRAHPSGRVYVVERDRSYPAPDPQTGLLVLSGTTPLTRLPSGYGLGPVAIRPDTGIAYALDTLYGTLYLLSGTQVLTEVSLQPWMASSLVPRPESMALDPGTGMIYVGHQGASLMWVISGTEVQTLSLSSFGYDPTVGALTADPAHGVVYVGLRSSTQMLLISRTEVLTSVQWTGSPPGLSAIAVDPQRGWLYGLGRAFSIAVFSVTTPVTHTFWVTSVDCGMSPFALAVQPVNGLAYAGCSNGQQGFVQILNGPDIITRVSVSGYAKALAADPTTGWVYAALSGARSAAVFSGTTMYTVSLPFDPDRAWFNPVDGTGYIAGGSRVAVLEGPVLRYVLQVGIYPDSVAFDPHREQAYLTHYGDNRVILFRKLPYKSYLPLVLRAR